MRYFFGARVVVEPVRAQRLEHERQAEASFSFTHHINPMRQMNDELMIRAEVESPKGMSEGQQRAFERALNRMARHLRLYIAEEFDLIEHLDSELEKKHVN